MQTTDSNSNQLLDFARRHPRLFILTGAGISVDSGIPTYRDKTGQWQRSEPITHQAFVTQSSSRQRYWARSFIGWKWVRDARPNDAHRALSLMESRGQVEWLVTQNVDRLHQRAGSGRVTDLHGRLDRVYCLDCGGNYCREEIQLRLQAENPQLINSLGAPAPDGDAEAPSSLVASLQPPSCQGCGGMLMPEVVFFGGSVPRARVEHCMAALERADAVLAIGSSLQVYSGFRFCRQAAAQGKPIALINPGTTRADSLASLKITADCAPILSALGDQHL